ncbi:hypothetical protein [Pseudoalteromonas luteoviolacea]|uniref:DUF3325 domain-containing protein n=1 Tax=Pseudoalteromonas luteoviolacea H33 TaxID=1365251 RepID=A0A167D4T6_9GAMM|nr:hypothetical protein [Pseudoalteromonas luteoviolacea]KZN48414.1 hypothetical protein N476_21320 [Pseudoalteromonas luteoviolacea H33]KZN73275.1 hypothetical protein N477_23420 [Pseudoalteromonas luteoviolacea H33-S]
MNYWVFAAGILALLTAMIHIIAGQLDPIRPFLKSKLDKVVKATLLACWHMISLLLLVSAAFLIFAGWQMQPDLQLFVQVVASLYIGFSIIFITVGGYFFKFQAMLKLPQWTLLLPVGCLAFYGVY